MTDPGEVTGLLVARREGDRAAMDRLIPIVYDDLRRPAEKCGPARRWPPTGQVDR